MDQKGRRTWKEELEEARERRRLWKATYKKLLEQPQPARPVDDTLAERKQAPGASQEGREEFLTGFVVVAVVVAVITGVAIVMMVRGCGR